MSIRETYTATVTLDVQQLFELQKSIADRVVKYLLATDEEYPYRAEDMATLVSVSEMLDPHIALVTEGYEGEIAAKEATILDNDEEVRKFMEE